jgi:hypothetical protein
MCALAGFYGPASGPLLEAAGGTLLVRCARTQVQQLVQMTTYLPLRSLNSLGARAISRSISSGRASVPHVGSCFTFTSAHCCALGCFQQRSNANAKRSGPHTGCGKRERKVQICGLPRPFRPPRAAFTCSRPCAAGNAWTRIVTVAAL